MLAMMVVLIILVFVYFLNAKMDDKTQCLFKILIIRIIYFFNLFFLNHCIQHASGSFVKFSNLFKHIILKHLIT